MTEHKRFWSKVGVSDGCWEWMSYLNPRSGVGQFYFRGTAQKAPRVAWMLKHGNIPGSLQVLHKCDNPRCTRPTHLFLGTRNDNMKDMAMKWRSGRSKLSKESVIEIRRRRLNGETYASIANDFDVTLQAIHYVCVHYSYGHLS